MAQWALANLSKEDLNRYNLAVESGDMDTVRSAVMSLAYRYQKAVGSDPKLVNGQNGGGAGGYESLAQLTAANRPVPSGTPEELLLGCRGERCAQRR